VNPAVAVATGRDLPTAPTFLGVSLKMYFDHDTTLEWTKAILDIVTARPGLEDDVEVAVIPSFPSLQAVSRLANPLGVQVGAQNLSEHLDGPYTGEVSWRSLVQVGCRYVEIGHSERRTLFGETDQIVAAKTAVAWSAGLVPLLCLGEARRQAPDEAASQCVQQLADAIPTTPPLGQPELVIAYEPRWAIGAERAASADHIGRVAHSLHRWMAQHRPAVAVRVIYGGTAGPGLLSRLPPCVDGLFLGRLAHEPTVFAEVLDEAVARAVAARRTA
jgi:triosephosphate isomerase